MRLTASLLAATLIFAVAPAALADSIQLSVDSSVHATFTSPSSSWWGIYSTMSSSPSNGGASIGHSGVEANFANVSLFIPDGSVINSATIDVIVPSSQIIGTGTLYVVQGLAAPYPGLSVAPSFNRSGTSLISASFVNTGGPLAPIINGNEISTGDLGLLIDFGGNIFASASDPGLNWIGYIGGDGQVDIPYTVQLNVDYSPVPEPSSIALLGTGLLGLAGFARRKFLS